MGRVYLARHGETAYNRQGRFRGRAEVPLTPLGREQARALGGAVAGKVSIIYTSPLRRAVETAREAAAAAGIPVRVAEELTDIDYGAWQGLHWREVSARYPEHYRCWCQRPEEVLLIPGGEGLAGVRARALPLLQRLLGADGDSLVIAHEVVNKVLLQWALGMEAGGFWRLVQHPGCLNIIELHQGEPVVVLLNDTCHLKELRQ